MPGAPVTAALLAALPQEVRPFLRLVRARLLSQGALPVWTFDFAGRTGVAALTGMGASRAAGAAASLLEHYQPRAIISVGFGGAVTPELPPGSLVLGETFWRYEPATGKLAGPGGARGSNSSGRGAGEAHRGGPAGLSRERGHHPRHHPQAQPGRAPPGAGAPCPGPRDQRPGGLCPGSRPAVSGGEGRDRRRRGRNSGHSSGRRPGPARPQAWPRSWPGRPGIPAA